MPSLTFVMPHWLYWSGLLLFPLIATYFAARQERLKPPPGQMSLAISYLLLVTGGFVGLHRFYVRRYVLAFVYIVLFVGILYGNHQGAGERVLVSNARDDMLGLQYDVELAQKAVAEGEEGAAEKLTEAQQKLEALKPRLAEVETVLNRWHVFSGTLGALILMLMIMDAYLLPRMTRRCAEEEARSGKKAKEIRNPRDSIPEDPAALVHSPLTDPIDKLSGLSGQFVCYWSVLAVFVYYYEVVARYVFNSPTNWAHESMFLMFGMQYLLAGAYALREDNHVRVDVIYLYFPTRMKAIVDILTSVFFFIFTVGLLVTGIIFASDSVQVWEVSFTEWAIQYWPVKMTIALGGLLITLQGLAKLIKDIKLLKTGEA